MTTANPKADRFHVYVTAEVFVKMHGASRSAISEKYPLSQETKTPLPATEAMLIAGKCMRRIGVGYVRVVCVTDDTTNFEWCLGELFYPRTKEGGSIFEDTVAFARFCEREGFDAKGGPKS